MKSFTQKPANVTRQWHHVDASGQTLGRLSTEISKLLIGKHKPTYTPHVDGGDFVVVTNAAQVKVTGQKLDTKKYFRYSGYPGGMRSKNLNQQLEDDPGLVINTAVKGMLPDNKLRKPRLRRLKVYAGEDHPHQAQEPKEVKFNG